MSDTNQMDLIVAIGSAIATGLATLAAFRSAKSAESAQTALFEDQLRSGRREVANLISACAYELRRIRFLAHTLNVVNRANAVFAGGFAGSRHKLMENGVAKRLASAEDLYLTVANFHDNPVSIGKLVQEDIDRLHIDLTVRLAELRAITAELDRESASREAQLLQNSERAKTSGPQQ